MDFPPTRKTAAIMLAVGLLALTANIVLLAVANWYYRILFLLGPFPVLLGVTGLINPRLLPVVYPDDTPAQDVKIPWPGCLCALAGLALGVYLAFYAF